MNRILFCITLLAITTAMKAVNGQGLESVDAVIEQWCEDDDLANASIGFYAIDLKSGKVLADFNGEKSMIPASMMKLSTTIAALDILGSDYQYSNELHYTGFIDEEGVLYGDIIFSGNGDPTFGSTRIGERPDRIIADYSDAVKKMGIRQIVGNVLIDKSAFNTEVPGTWSWEDLTNYYASVPHPINFLENQFSMVFSTGVAGSKAILNSVTPEVPNLNIQNEVRAGDVSGDETFCFGHPFGNNIEVRGVLPENQRAYRVKGAIPDPGEFFATKVLEALVRSGVKWEGELLELAAGEVEEESAERSLIVRFGSPPLREIVAQTNRHSVNLFAEGILVSLGGDSGLSGGLVRISDFWTKNLAGGAEGLVQKDGSGLSHFNAISARQLSEMLAYAHSRPFRDVLEGSLPVAGVSGTVRSFGDGGNLAGNLRAKSGYMTGNRGYAGYLNMASGRKIAFTVIVNHYSISAGAMRQKLQALLEDFAESN